MERKISLQEITNELKKSGVEAVYNKRFDRVEFDLENINFVLIEYKSWSKSAANFNRFAVFASHKDYDLIRNTHLDFKLSPSITAVYRDASSFVATINKRLLDAAKKDASEIAQAVASLSLHRNDIDRQKQALVKAGFACHDNSYFASYSSDYVNIELRLRVDSIDIYRVYVSSVTQAVKLVELIEKERGRNEKE